MGKPNKANTDPAKKEFQWGIGAVVASAAVYVLLYGSGQKFVEPEHPAAPAHPVATAKPAAHPAPAAEAPAAKPAAPTPAPAPAPAPKPAAEPAPVASATPPAARPPAAPAIVRPAGPSDRVRGTVLLKGTPPPEKEMSAVKADKNCGALHSAPVFSRNFVVGANGGLGNVFVRIKSREGGAVPATPRTEAALIDQVGCIYEPYMIGVMVNQPLTMRNSDPMMHNINATAKANQGFNIAQARQGQTDTKAFAKPEMFISLQCNVHPWMFAYVGVVEHPFFAVTAPDGWFELPPGLPPGRYTLEAVHRKAGTATADFTVAADGSANVQLELKVP